jgi:hypothetical protein
MQPGGVGGKKIKSSNKSSKLQFVSIRRLGRFDFLIFNQTYPDLVSKSTEILKFSESAEPCELAHTLLSGPGIAWLRG